MTEKLVTVSPLAYSDRKYVYKTARRSVLAHLGEFDVDYTTVRDLVDHLVSECKTSVATIKGVGDEYGRLPEIQGFIVLAPDRTVEFLHLKEIYKDLPATNMMGAGVVRALLGALTEDRELVIRRRFSKTTMVALRAGNVKAVIRPRSV